jgi:hypothetical protein
MQNWEAYKDAKTFCKAKKQTEKKRDKFNTAHLV